MGNIPGEIGPQKVLLARDDSPDNEGAKRLVETCRRSAGNKEGASPLFPI